MTGSAGRQERVLVDGALFVMPRSVAGQTGPVGMWLMVAGWAAAARRIWGESWLLTPEGVVTPEEARSLASRRTATGEPGSSWKRWVPTTLKTLAKDVREWRRATRFAHRPLDGEWGDRRLAFIWQRHDLFQDAGHRLARRYDVPLVLCVDAPVVWEARRWGVRRPGWGRLLERVAENPLLRSADLVACVSDEVADEVKKRGVAPERILVTPNGVDVEVFTPDVPGSAVRDRHSLGDRFVLGWIGSFHRFHGLELAIDAVAELDDSADLTLMLVGDGLDRARIEEHARRAGLSNVVFTGTIEHADIPQYIAAMDAALVSSDDPDAFHYSPLKLKEYMACGKPVIGPRLGELRQTISDGEDGILVEPGDVASLAAAIRRLQADPAMRAQMGTAARNRMVQEGSWERQVRRTVEALGSGLVP